MTSLRAPGQQPGGSAADTGCTSLDMCGFLPVSFTVGSPVLLNCRRVFHFGHYFISQLRLHSGSDFEGIRLRGA